VSLSTSISIVLWGSQTGWPTTDKVIKKLILWVALRLLFW